jgi:hypothetical protein
MQLALLKIAKGKVEKDGDLIIDCAFMPHARHSFYDDHQQRMDRDQTDDVSFISSLINSLLDLPSHLHAALEDSLIQYRIRESAK